MGTSDASVLVVDDEESLADLYADWLRDDYDVTVAYDGETALEMLAERSVDVVLLDRHIPEVAGDQVLTILRNWGSDARVAMVTGVSPDTDILDLGFDDYLVKPVDSDTLTEAVESLVAADAYETLRTELTSLQVKRNVLEMELPEDERETDERYVDLRERIAELEARLADHRDTLGWEPSGPPPATETGPR